MVDISGATLSDNGDSSILILFLTLVKMIHSISLINLVLTLGYNYLYLEHYFIPTF